MTTLALTQLGDALQRTADSWAKPVHYYVIPGFAGRCQLLKRNGRVVAAFPNDERPEALRIAHDLNLKAMERSGGR